MIEGPWDNIIIASNHLQFYTENRISPVSQDITDLQAHFDRRGSLYRCLGLLPSAFRDAAVLEVGPGSGHNSLFIAKCRPRIYDLVEPNPTGVEGINRLYDTFSLPHTRPTVHPVMLERFVPPQAYDIAISENWLGSPRHEREMLRVLSDTVAPGGVLCVTSVSPVGIVSNVLRKIMAQRLIVGIPTLAMQTALLMEAFSSHLATLASMSRPHADWIQDNLLNPAYYGVCLTPGMVVDTIGDHFHLYGSSPRITQDWRWYKSLVGEGKNFNGAFLDDYYQGLHNHLDHRVPPTRRDAAENRRLEDAAWRLLATASQWELEPETHWGALLDRVAEVADLVSACNPTAGEAVAEFLALFRRAAVTPAEVAAMTAFRPLFGREMVYLSLTRDAGTENG